MSYELFFHFNLFRVGRSVNVSQSSRSFGFGKFFSQSSKLVEIKKGIKTLENVHFFCTFYALSNIEQ